MPEQMTTIHPKSLDEIPKGFRDWWAKYQGHVRLKIHFSRPSQSENLLIMRSPLEPDIRVKFDKDALSCERSGKKLYVNLDNFDLLAKVDGCLLLCEFKLREATLRPLKEKLTAVENTKNRVFFTRAINALTELEHIVPTQLLEQASTASTDYLVLLGALATPLVATQMAAKDPLAAARLRGVERQQSLLKRSGGVLTGEEAAKILGISRQAVDKRRRQGHLIGLTQGKRGYAYPAWQFESDRTIDDLETVLGALRGHDPWMQLAFFVNANDRLNGKSPLEMLLSHKIAPILQAAASYGEQGAA